MQKAKCKMRIRSGREDYGWMRAGRQVKMQKTKCKMRIRSGRADYGWMRIDVEAMQNAKVKMQNGGCGCLPRSHKGTNRAGPERS